MEEETHYLTLKSSNNASTLIFSQQYSNVTRVELCYASVPVKEKGEPIVLDIEELRTGYTDEGLDVIKSRETTSPVRGFFITIPVDALEPGENRIFKETSDYLYGINYSTPLNFTRLTTRVLDQSGKPGHEGGHTIVLRIISRRLSDPLPPPPQQPRRAPPPRNSQRPVIMIPSRQMLR